MPTPPTTEAFRKVRREIDILAPTLAQGVWVRHEISLSISRAFSGIRRGHQGPTILSGGGRRRDGQELLARRCPDTHARPHEPVGQNDLPGHVQARDHPADDRMLTIKLRLKRSGR